MNDAQTPASSENSIPENQQLVQLEEEAAATASAPDLRERVRELTEETLDELADAVVLRRTWAEIETLLGRRDD